MKQARLNVFAFLASIFLFSVISCEGPGESSPKSVDYGPEVASKDITNAIANTYRDSDPTQTKVGAYVHFETNDDVGEGALKLITGDTAQTVTNRTEDAVNVSFDIIEIHVKYHQSDNTSSTVTRGYQLPFKKHTSSSAAESSVQVADSETTQQIENWLQSFAIRRVGLDLAAKPPEAKIDARALAALAAAPTPAPTPAPAPTPDDQIGGPIKVTFHGLKVWEDNGPPPAAVKAQAGCLGIPGCSLTYRHVAFDIVFWRDPQGERTHIELTTSPQVPQVIGFEMFALIPYIPGLMKSCVTQLILVSGGRTTTKTLVTECQQVDDFLY
jgi:hypothetical protein